MVVIKTTFTIKYLNRCLKIYWRKTISTSTLWSTGIERYVRVQSNIIISKKGKRNTSRP